MAAISPRERRRGGNRGRRRGAKRERRRSDERDSPTPISDERVELEIAQLAAGGDGVGRAPDGRVVFVPFSAPGDRVRVRITARGSSYARGVVEALLEPGRARVDPVCAVFGSCGGCTWQHVDYAAQLEAKREIAAAALRRIGGLALPEREALPITPSPSPYRYRTRSRVLVEAGKVGYRRRRSHALAPTSRCPVLVEALEQQLASLAADPPRRDGEWELVASLAADPPRRDGGGELVAGLGADLAEPATRALPLPAADGPRIWLCVGEDRIGVSPGVFVQSNAGLLEALAHAVASAAGAGRLALELFCGAGFFTLGLARSFEQVVAVDSNPAAICDLELNLRNARLANVRARMGPVEAALDELELARLRPDCVVLDPPRVGLGEGVVARIAALAPERVVYLSCDPATLARDLSRLDHLGYALLRAECFDLFPQTPHIEVLAVAAQASIRPWRTA